MSEITLSYPVLFSVVSVFPVVFFAFRRSGVLLVGFLVSNCNIIRFIIAFTGYVADMKKRVKSTYLC